MGLVPYAASYITPAEARDLAHLDTEPSESQVERASRLVVKATRGARYSLASDGSGYPADPIKLAACKRAAALQVAAWVGAGIEQPGAIVSQRRIGSKSAGGASVTYIDDPAAAAQLADLQRGDTLVGDALDVLRDAGMLTAGIAAAGAIARTSGVLD